MKPEMTSIKASLISMALILVGGCVNGPDVKVFPTPKANYGGLDEPPKMIFAAKPFYPFDLYSGHITGKVLVDFIIDSEGKVLDAKAVRSTRIEFAAAAVDAINRCIFSPGLKNGRPVYSHVQEWISFDFESGLPVSAPPKAGRPQAASPSP